MKNYILSSLNILLFKKYKKSLDKILINFIEKNINIKQFPRLRNRINIYIILKKTDINYLNYDLGGEYNPKYITGFIDEINN